MGMDAADPGDLAVLVRMDGKRWDILTKYDLVTSAAKAAEEQAA